MKKGLNKRAYSKKFKNWSWPQSRWLKVEFACPDGIGHSFDIHGCDGCCGHKSFRQQVGPLYRKMILSGKLSNFEKVRALKKWGLEDVKKKSKRNTCK